MSFATANVQTSKFGNLKVTFGDWSCATADASGTIGVDGGRVYMCHFEGQDGTSPLLPWSLTNSTSVSGNVTTITVYPQTGVTTGRFLIIHK